MNYLMVSSCAIGNCGCIIIVSCVSCLQLNGLRSHLRSNINVYEYLCYKMCKNVGCINAMSGMMLGNDVWDDFLTVMILASIQMVSTIYPYIHTSAGTIINIGVERFACAEMLFDSTGLDISSSALAALNLRSTQPDALQSTSSANGIAHLAVDSVLKCDAELQG